MQRGANRRGMMRTRLRDYLFSDLWYFSTKQ